MKLLSVIIVTYNSTDIIYGCLDSVFRYNDIGPDLEVIIVDNNSQATEEMFSTIRSRYKQNIILIRNFKNGGYGYGNNVGIRAASAPFVMIMNPDVRLIEAVFKKHLLLFEDKNVAIIGMQQMVSTIKKGYSFGNLRISLRNNLYLKWCHILNKYNPQKQYIAGACFMIKKSAMIGAGMFDENIFLYGEERDLHYRVTKLNKNNKIKYEPSMRYLHLKGDQPLSVDVIQYQFISYLYWCNKVNLDSDKNRSKFVKMLIRRRLKALIMIEKETYRIYSEALRKIELNNMH